MNEEFELGELLWQRHSDKPYCSYSEDFVIDVNDNGYILNNGTVLDKNGRCVSSGKSWTRFTNKNRYEWAQGNWGYHLQQLVHNIDDISFDDIIQCVKILR